MTKLTVTRIPKLNTLVIKQLEGKDFFVASSSVIVMSIQNFSYLLKFLVNNGIISHKILEVILEEYHEEVL